MMQPHSSRPVSHFAYAALLSICLPLFFLISGCAGGPGALGGSSSMPVVTIAASPTSITPGSSSTLTVAATNATTVTITGTNGASFTLSPTGGTETVKPTATTTYTVTATGTAGTTTATVTITVAATTATTVTITASPTSITAGASSTLTVIATNATKVTVTGTDGSSYTLASSGGNPSVSPAATTTYTATATGSSGTVTATATVTVAAYPVPTVTMTANPTAILAGNSSILTVMAMNAATVTIAGSDGTSYTLTPSGGAQAVKPATTTTYTATAVGSGGTVTATATVTVNPNPVPTVSITANPASIVVGNSSTLTVTASNATTVTVSGTDGTSDTLPGTSGGLQSVSPATTTTYTATATGPGGTVTATATITVTPNPAPTVTIAANPTSIVSGNSSLLTVVATNSNSVTIAGTDGSSYALATTGGNQSVTPGSTTTYTVTATGAGGSTTANTTVTVTAAGSVDDIDHVIFMLQENHTFDDYFGQINTYRINNGYTTAAGVYETVDGANTTLSTLPASEDDAGTVYPPYKFTSTCIDDMSSDWLASEGDVNRYDLTPTRAIDMNGFVHTAEGYATSCTASGTCSGTFSGDPTGERSMGYYDQGFLNYYYYMASQFALSDRWFSPVADKSISNRIATFTGGTTQGLVEDPGNDGLPQLNIETIFQELQNAGVSWKIYYTVTQGNCLDEDDCPTAGGSLYPATDFTYLEYSYSYLKKNPTGSTSSVGDCPTPLQPSSVIGDTTNSFCIDPTHIAPIDDLNYGYYADLNNGTLPSFAFIEAGYGVNDEHPGSGQSILKGQAEVAEVVNALMASSSWHDSVFFLSYDEGGGPFDHVPPVGGSSNLYTSIGTSGTATATATTLGVSPPDIGQIAVNPDQQPVGTAIYQPCLPPTPPGTPTTHCDLPPSYPGNVSTDVAYNLQPYYQPKGRGFAAQLGFRVPNMVISPFTIPHYVSHIPMDHTAIIKFVEDRFIPGDPSLTSRDALQPNLLNFFDFTNPPWATPPTPPTPVSDPTNATCTPASFGGP